MLHLIKNNVLNNMERNLISFPSQQTVPIFFFNLLIHKANRS